VVTQLLLFHLQSHENDECLLPPTENWRGYIIGGERGKKEKGNSCGCHQQRYWSVPRLHLPKEDVGSANDSSARNIA